MIRSSILLTTLSVLFASVFICCEMKVKKKQDGEKKTDEPSGKNDIPNAQVNNTATDCDALWKYVYNPDRLEVIDKCKTVTGIIEESNADDDGDEHMLLKLDAGQDELLTKKNRKKKQGDLVIEAVCANKVELKKVGSTCEGYINKIMIPKLGEHVKVTGSLVLDSHNGWAEIHPITKIEVLK